MKIEIKGFQSCKKGTIDLSSITDITDIILELFPTIITLSFMMSILGFLTGMFKNLKI